MLIFFLDENFQGNTFADVLRAANIPIELHKNRFKPGTDDTVWIPWVAAQGWVSVTGDKKTRFRPQEKEAIVASLAKMIHLVHGKDSTRRMLAHNFVYSCKDVTS